MNAARRAPRRLVSCTFLLALLGALGLLCAVARSPSARADDKPTPAPTPTTVPFLQLPFAGTYAINSYVDHQFPTYQWDDTIAIYTGDQASAIDGIKDRLPTFRGGYWLPQDERYLYYDGHNGIDYDTGGGTTILAAAAGEVVFAGAVPSGCDSPLQYVCIAHEGGYRTFYLHLDGTVVHKGEQVEAGDPVGISGNSGCSGAAHLHFAVDRDRKYTDPYGWHGIGRADPLIAYSGEQATWLWKSAEPFRAKGVLVEPPSDARTNGPLELAFRLDPDSPPVSQVAFMAYHAGAWHTIGVDEQGEDGWSWEWDTGDVPEGEVWLHAWPVGTDGRVSKGSPIRTDVVVDRHPPEGYLMGLVPDSAAGERLWLYAASHDPDSQTRSVTMLARETGGAEWREIGQAEWLHSSSWLLVWDADVPDGTRLDVAARLTDEADNVRETEPMRGITIDRGMVGGQLALPGPETLVTGTLVLRFVPFPESAPIAWVTFHAWYDGAWHEVAEGREGGDGWSGEWDPAGVTDQVRMRVQARPYDAAGRVNSALPQATDLILDRTPPKAGFSRPRTGGVARPGVSALAWASDEGSGVARVAFYIDAGSGWALLGEDTDESDGWRLLWEADDLPDGNVAFGLQATDRAGNAHWAEEQVNVALDRTPPSGRYAWPSTGMQLGETVTLTLEVTDTLSGLDRAIFYARYDNRWHHLGADETPEDGFQQAWDTTALAGQHDIALTAWVYDRAGNHADLVYVERLSVEGGAPAPQPTQPLTPAPSPSATPLRPSTVTPAGRAATAMAAATRAAPSPTAGPLPTYTGQPAELPQPAQTRTRPAFWYLIGGGLLVAAALLVHALRDLGAGRPS
ncbi:MAG TPA: peptidoglycan DD-metalloendopeptidase family protein [Anaerolineae bacterium]|nr:peptidoglycan DD-metalloendopeptidase family protein [Anaerolineae bacterium]